MQHRTSTPDPADIGAQSPSLNLVGGQTCQEPTSADLRVGAFLQNLAAARGISDDEVRQHAADCTFLMESAYDRFQAFENPADRDEAYLWMSHRDESLRMLSPAWKAAREAEIQRPIGADYFIEQADQDRQAMAGRAGR